MASDNQPRSYSDPSGSNGKDGYKYDEDDKMWFPVQTQDLPPNPAQWEIEDKLCCHYVSLGIIRDMIYADKTKPIVKNILQGTKAKTDAFSFVCYFIENANANKEMYSDESIELALSQVKQDLKKVRSIETEPAGTEQETTAAKRGNKRGWFRNHPHRYSLTVSIILLILFLVLGLFKAEWRQWCWGVAGFAFLVLIVSLLGGRSSK